MEMPLARRVAERVPDAASIYHRLVLVVGPPRTGKTNALRGLAEEQGWPLVNVNLRLSERLLDLTSKQRALHVPRILSEILGRHSGEVVLLDNTEVLFSRSLRQDPLRLLQGLSRNRTVVACWSGDMEDGRLTYAEPPHPEHRRYLRPDAIIVPTVCGSTGSGCSQTKSAGLCEEKPK
jgi:hypothetical protein